MFPIDCDSGKSAHVTVSTPGLKSLMDVNNGRLKYAVMRYCSTFTETLKGDGNATLGTLPARGLVLGWDQIQVNFPKSPIRTMRFGADNLSLPSIPPTATHTNEPKLIIHIMKPPIDSTIRRTAALSMRYSAALLAFGTLTSAPLSEAAVTYSVGDLLLGFHTDSGVGSGTSFVFNLGPAVNYRNNAYTTPPVNDVGTVLSDTFGSNWYTRSDLYWGVAAVRDAAGGGPNTVVNGDARGTIYVSKPASAPGDSTPWTLASGPTVISAATSIATMQGASGSDLSLSGGFEGAPEAPNTGGRGALQNEGTFINSWDEFNPIGGNAFGNILTGGVQGAFGTGQPMTYLDVHRVVGRESASATPNDPAGQGRYITTFTINSNGIIGTVPEPGSALLLGLAGGAVLLRRRRA
jgi:hypothetical protein